MRSARLARLTRILGPRWFGAMHLADDSHLLPVDGPTKWCRLARAGHLGLLSPLRRVSPTAVSPTGAGRLLIYSSAARILPERFFPCGGMRRKGHSRPMTALTPSIAKQFVIHRRPWSNTTYCVSRSQRRDTKRGAGTGYCGRVGQGLHPIVFRSWGPPPSRCISGGSPICRSSAARISPESNGFPCGGFQEFCTRL